MLVTLEKRRVVTWGEELESSYQQENSLAPHIRDDDTPILHQQGALLN